MARVTLFAILSIFPATKAHAQVNGLQVRPVDREELTQSPRDAVSITFVVRNGTGRTIEADPLLTLPAGWRAMTADLPFDLTPRAAAIRLVGFAIPDRAAAGDYSVTYRVRDRRELAISTSYTVLIHVKPNVNIQTLPLESPEYVVAGERYESAFLVRNLSNAAITAKFTVKSAQGTEPTPRAGTLKLDVGESGRVVITTIAPAVRRRTEDQLTLAVEVTGTEIRACTSNVTHIVPRVSPDEAYRTLSTRAEVAFVGRESDGQGVSGWQPGVSGGGALDQAGEHVLNFRLRGPDMRERGSLGAADEYWIRYHSNAVSAELGDGVYGLTPLTEPGRYGTGGAFEYDGENWGLAMYRLRDRFSSQGVEQTAIGTHYRPTSDTRIDATMLDITQGPLPGTIYSLRTRTHWSNALNTDVEWGDSDGGKAMRADIRGAAGGLRYYATSWRADSDYRGYLRDKKYLSTGFDVPRGTGWGLHGYYRLQDWNLEPPADFVLDPRQSPNVQDLIQFAPTERQASLGTDHALGAASRFTLDLTQRARTDGHSFPQIDTTNRSIRVGLSRSLKQFSLLYSIERGITENEITTERFDTALQLLSASWQPSASQTYGLFVFRDDNAFSNEREPAETSFGLTAAYALGRGTSLSFNAQRNFAQRLENQVGTTSVAHGSLYNVALSHEQDGGGRVALVARRIAGRLAQTDVLLMYSAPFAVPVARKADVGSVVGRVFDSETGQGLSDVVLNLDGLTAVTDRSGAFAFPVVTANAYRLSMDRANVDVGKVPVDDLPRDVQVAPRQRQEVEIALVRTVTIAAIVRIAGGGKSREPRDSSAPSVATDVQLDAVSSARGANGSARNTDGAPPSAVANALLTLRRGDVVYRRLTDASGRMQLAGLAPGFWSVSLAPESLPAGYAVPAERRFELVPGATLDVAFELLPIARDIRMLPPLDVH